MKPSNATCSEPEFESQLFESWLWDLGTAGGEGYSTTEPPGRPQSVTGCNMSEGMSHYLATLAVTSVDNIIRWDSTQCMIQTGDNAIVGSHVAFYYNFVCKRKVSLNKLESSGRAASPLNG